LQKYGILNEKNYIAAMKNKVKRTIYMLLVAVILFSYSMIAKAEPGSLWIDLLRGAGLGLALAGSISCITLIVEHFKSDNTPKR
jgi:hypothetical protein